MNENFLMHYDITTGDILGFYLKSIHGDNIPTPNKEITPEEHKFYMENNGKYKLNPSSLEDEEIQVTAVAPESSQEYYLINLDYRLSKIELGV